MLIEMNGEKYNCRLARREFDEKGHQFISDNRNVTRCENSADCATCMWNINYALKRRPKLELRCLTKKQLASLKKRNKFYPIEANKLMALKPKKGARNGGDEDAV